MLSSLSLLIIITISGQHIHCQGVKKKILAHQQYQIKDSGIPLSQK